MTKNAACDPMDFSFSTSPENYRHLVFKVTGEEAIISLNINPEQGLRKDALLKLNSYDLSVDIELADALNRLRFEYPEVLVVTITSSNPQIFSAGANIYMLKKSSHAFKVNFCKYTNETRLYMEEASLFSNKRFLCALNGTAAGGGYELALACDKIILIDDKNANVSLPEVPLLGVLPGTGGLTRLSDKRKIRKDRSDIFCTVSEGIKGAKAKLWNLVDEVYLKSQWDEGVKKEIFKLKTELKHMKSPGINLSAIEPKKSPSGFSYKFIDVKLEPERVAIITVFGPKTPEPTEVSAMLEQGEELWLMRAFRELDDAILRLRFFYREHGLLEIRTEGDKKLILDAEKPLYNEKDHWFLREVRLQIARVLRRLEMSSKSIVAVIDEKSAYAGVLAEMLFIADRSYALLGSSSIELSKMSYGLLPTWSENSRLDLRFLGSPSELLAIKNHGSFFDLKTAFDLGLISVLSDEIDFYDELRLFKEERASLSPDALSAMEANLRIAGPETLATKIFGRLSAWQNWVFIRENATGPRGALMSYGEEIRPEFDLERC